MRFEYGVAWMNLEDDDDNDDDNDDIESLIWIQKTLVHRYYT